MKQTLTTLIVIAAMAPAVWAQDRIYRCGNEYTNNAAQAKERGCKLVEGGNVTVVQGARPKAASGAAASASTTASAATPAGAPRVDNSEQRARDADARAILESELRKAEARHAELLKEYNDGAPVRNALDLRNPQVYMERTAELKASVARSESDLAGIRRELARLAPPSCAK
jgi:predicted lipid-binding transport protein (Tim44 family)